MADTNALLEWLNMFDARMANLTRRQKSLLRDLGVEQTGRKAPPDSVHDLA